MKIAQSRRNDERQKIERRIEIKMFLSFGKK